MRLSHLKVLIAIQMIAWCVLGTIVHGWQILYYPAAWIAIGAAFWAINQAYERRHAQPVQPLTTTGRPSPELKRPIERSTNATANVN